MAESFIYTHHTSVVINTHTQQGCQTERKGPIGLLLTAVGTVKFGLGALIATFGLPFESLETGLEWKLADFGLLFASVWHHDLRKIWQP